MIDIYEWMIIVGERMIFILIVIEIVLMDEVFQVQKVSFV